MNNPESRLGRAGFTLIEILVALILISLLVAAVFPVVTQQTSKADAPRLAGDLASIRSGIEIFGADMRNRQPNGFADLVTAAAVSTDSTDIGGRDYLQSHVDRWDGPYIDVVGADSIVSGFGGRILPNFVLYDAASANNTTGVPAAADFVAVQINGLVEADFVRLNDLIDGNTDSGATAGRPGGRLRAPDVGGNPSFSPAYYLAVPFR